MVEIDRILHFLTLNTTAIDTARKTSRFFGVTDGRLLGCREMDISCFCHHLDMRGLHYMLSAMFNTRESMVNKVLLPANSFFNLQLFHPRSFENADVAFVCRKTMFNIPATIIVLCKYLCTGR